MRQNIINFYKQVYRDNKHRRFGKRNVFKDTKLYVRNKWLRLFREKQLIKKYYSEVYPIVFIVSVPRSGSTLLAQLLADYSSLGFVSNFVARYWLCPVYGAEKISQQFSKSQINYESFLGGTSGQNSPHEFGYFWQYWTDHKDHDELDDEACQELPWARIREELYGLSGYFGKPLVVKSIVYTDFKVKWLAKEFPNARFIHIEREPEYVIQSLFEARIKRYGSADIWWSIRPRNWQDLSSLSPIQQVVNQYVQVYSAIRNSMKQLNDDICLSISYEDLIEDPGKVLDRINQLVGIGVNAQNKDKKLPELISGNIKRLPEDQYNIIQTELEKSIDQYQSDY